MGYSTIIPGCWQYLGEGTTRIVYRAALTPTVLKIAKNDAGVAANKKEERLSRLVGGDDGPIPASTRLWDTGARAVTAQYFEPWTGDPAVLRDDAMALGLVDVWLYAPNLGRRPSGEPVIIDFGYGY